MCVRAQAAAGKFLQKCTSWCGPALTQKPRFVAPEVKLSASADSDTVVTMTLSIGDADVVGK